MDADVTVTYEVSYDNSGDYYTERWTKQGKQVDRKINIDNGVCRLVISGKGIIAFTETENSNNFCNGNVYPTNYPKTPILLGETKSTPDGLPTLSSGSEFCVLFANANYTSTVKELDLPSSDSAEYSYGLQAGKLQKNQQFYDYGGNDAFNALCLYFKTSAFFARPKTFVLQVTGFLDIPNSDLYPPPANLPSPTFTFAPTDKFTGSKEFTQSDSFTPSKLFSQSSKFSPSKSFNPTDKFTASLKFGATPEQTKTKNIMISTPTRSRKVNILTDAPNISETEIVYDRNVRAVVMKEKLSSSEVATVVTSASVSVIMIVVTIVCFFMYMRSKAKQMKERTFSAEDSDLADSASYEDYSYSYSYYYPSYSTECYSSDSLNMRRSFYCDPDDIPYLPQNQNGLQTPDDKRSLLSFIDVVPSLGTLSVMSTRSNK